VSKQEKLDIVVTTINCIYDNWQNEGSFGRLVELIRERLDLHDVAGSWEAIQCAGGLSINNALPDIK
jgi:hypothetical protein